jgi:hypothetical protein
MTVFYGVGAAKVVFWKRSLADKVKMSLNYWTALAPLWDSSSSEGFRKVWEKRGKKAV